MARRTLKDLVQDLEVARRRVAVEERAAGSLGGSPRGRWTRRCGLHGSRPDRLD